MQFNFTCVIVYNICNLHESLDLASCFTTVSQAPSIP